MAGTESIDTGTTPTKSYYDARITEAKERVSAASAELSSMILHPDGTAGRSKDDVDAKKAEIKEIQKEISHLEVLREGAPDDPEPSPTGTGMNDNATDGANIAAPTPKNDADSEPVESSAGMWKAAVGIAAACVVVVILVALAMMPNASIQGPPSSSQSASTLSRLESLYSDEGDRVSEFGTLPAVYIANPLNGSDLVAGVLGYIGKNVGPGQIGTAWYGLGGSSQATMAVQLDNVTGSSDLSTSEIDDYLEFVGIDRSGDIQEGPINFSSSIKPETFGYFYSEDPSSGMSLQALWGISVNSQKVTVSMCI